MELNFRGYAFSDILNAVMEYAHDNRFLQAHLEENGIKITQRTLQNYRSSSTTPPFNTAKLILKYLKINMSDDEIRESLELEKIKKIEDLDLNGIVRKIKLKESDFNNIKEGFVMDVINERVNDLYPNVKNGFSLYIRDLIDEDIKNNVIKK